jgi:hypothetical protein
MNKATTTVGDMVLYTVIAVLVLTVGVLILRAISSDSPATHYIAEDPNAPNSEACKAMHIENLTRLTRMEQRGINTDRIVNRPLPSGHHFESYPEPCLLSDQREVKDRLEGQR